MSFPWQHSPPFFNSHSTFSTPSSLLFLIPTMLFSLFPLSGSDSLPQHGVTSHGHPVTNPLHGLGVTKPSHGHGHGVTKPSLTPTLPPSHRSHMDNAERLPLQQNIESKNFCLQRLKFSKCSTKYQMIGKSAFYQNAFSSNFF